MFFCVNNREQGGPFSLLCSFATPSFIKPLVSLKAGILLLPKLSSECFILQFMELRKYDQFNTIPKIQKHHHCCVTNALTLSLFLTHVLLLSKPLQLCKSLMTQRNPGAWPKMPFRRSLILSAGRKWSTAGLRWLTRGY